MTAELVVPVKVRHFYKPSGRLIATVVAVTMGNQVAVGIARCNKKDRPSKKIGRKLAETRLVRGLFPQTHVDQLVASVNAEQNLFKVMTQAQFDKLCATNPFNQWGCPFGAYDDQVAALRKKPVKKGKKATKKTTTKKRK